jgi:hypothetical protein
MVIKAPFRNDKLLHFVTLWFLAAVVTAWQLEVTRELANGWGSTPAALLSL